MVMSEEKLGNVSGSDNLLSPLLHTKEENKSSEKFPSSETSAPGMVMSNRGNRVPKKNVRLQDLFSC